ncbi:MAG: hypothetical protein D8M59_08885 [Planctomycetes bacterium]|nr:hypothetical protein [Planctomycetota bacterium]NOG53886.1 FAD-dependent oxidoreductase [Planctomycetota bacterium]
MIEIRIHGRGGQGGVTLAKIIATTRFLKGDSVQAFGIYAAERSGAPLQAFCRYDDQTITNRNLIYEPDHVIVLDPTLVPLGITSGLKPGGWILINTPESPEHFGDQFTGYRLATIDATSIAIANNLGTKTVPIVNTALAGAVAHMLGFTMTSVEKALEHLGFVGDNLTAAHQAYQQVNMNAACDPEAITVEHPVIPKTFTPGFLEGGGAQMPRIITGQWAKEQPDRQQMVPPCNHVCPAGNDVQGFLAAMARNEVDAALRTLLQSSPFPSICGRVCPAPCMDSCNRIHLDGAVNVRDIERSIGDLGHAEIKPIANRDERIAIIGSGPAGLTAAYHLGRLGYQVTLLEGGDELGGLLRTGIPSYRLPREVLDAEIERILLLGIEVKTGHRVSRQGLVRLANEFDAVLIATGLQEVRSLQLGLDDTDAVVQGIDFLDQVNRGEVRVDNEDVIIVGGGNTALDAARSALRLGANSVRVVYRRTRAEMPAISEEVDQAIEEDIAIDYLTMPVSMKPLGENGRHVLTCRRMELGEPDESGRRRPVEVSGSDFDIECSRMILALGQSQDMSVFPEGTEVRENGELIGLLEKPVYAIGDLATNDGTVAAAIGCGRRSALHIHALFTGEQLLSAQHDDGDVVRQDAMRMHLFEKQARDEGMAITAEDRFQSFTEVHQGLSGEPSHEAQRCLSCGVCNECDRCVTYCPEGVLTRVGHEFIFDYAYCKGCGVCASECPRNVIFMSRL